MVAEVSDATCTTQFPGMTTVKCVTDAKAVLLDSLGIGIQDLVQLCDCNSLEGFLTALRDKGVTSRDYSLSQ